MYTQSDYIVFELVNGVTHFVSDEEYWEYLELHTNINAVDEQG